MAWQGATAAGALAWLRAHPRQVDVALIDLGLPDHHGSTLIGWLREEFPGLHLLVLTIFDDGPNVLAALRAGARGYLVKHSESGALVAAIAAAARGESPVSPTVARFLLDAWRRHDEHHPGDGLTPRECDVLTHLGRGKSYAEVAAALSIGLGTVQSHIKSLYGKLGVNSRVEATSLARRRGMIA